MLLSGFKGNNSNRTCSFRTIEGKTISTKGRKEGK